MRRRAAVLVVLVILSACSSERGQQITSTAGMGAALGAPGGPIGVALGVVLGAAAGAIMPQGALEPEQAQSDDAASAYAGSRLPDPRTR